MSEAKSPKSSPKAAKKISIVDKTVNGPTDQELTAMKAAADAARRADAGKSYAELSAELDDVLARLQHDDVDIDEALQAYRRGMVLVTALDRYLKEAENKITKLRADFSG